MRIKAVICDIEGTTTSISFVKDTLFTYAFENCEKFINQNFDDKEVQEIISNLTIEAQKDDFQINENKDKREDFVHNIALYIQKLIKEDRKVGPLKSLQGKIWKFAFESNLVTGHVFDDVSPNFKKWSEQKKIEIYIYSSGSVEAQKLLFKYSLAGDLTTIINGYFDTNVGHKQEPKSYEKIISQIKHDPQDVLFLSDIPNELYAAQKAGMKTLLLNRPNNYEISETDKSQLSIVDDFDQIDLE